ncbi:MAG: type II secretion system protein [Candidatus Gastranaerophilaceae bacterium]
MNKSWISRFKNKKQRLTQVSKNSTISHAGFTLSEILITLGIIGVICAMTIPTLMQNAQERATIAAVKKVHSTLSQAYILAVQENGTPENWNLTAWCSSAGAENMLNALASYLNITKICGSATGCWINKTYTDLKNNQGINFYSDPRFAKAELIDGSTIATLIHNPNCTNINGTSTALKTVCGNIWVDINGYKKPNQYGVDLFIFWISKSGIIPLGTQGETLYTFGSYCNKNSTGAENGIGCAAWLIYSENMDYLHCNNLSWGGKTKCD